MATITLNISEAAANEIVIGDTIEGADNTYTSDVVTYAQTFLVSGTINVSKIAVTMGIINNPTSPVQLHIYSTSGGEPNTLLYSSTNTETPSGFAELEFLFSGASLTAGTYAFVFSYGAGTHDATHNYTVAFDNGNDYSDGTMFTKLGAGAWVDQSPDDIFSTIYY